MGACNVLIFGKLKKEKNNNKGAPKDPNLRTKKDPMLVDSFILHALVSCHLIP